MRITTEPRSDQWNADDFIGGPRTFTIAGVKVGVAEQKYDIELVEGEGRAWRPPLTVLRLLVAGWGDDATVWPGRRVTLYRDPTIRFGKDQVGGIRISHMSHLPDGKPLKENLTVTRGRRSQFVVQPLPDAPAPPTDGITPAQMKDLGAAFDAAGVAREARLDYCQKLIGREISKPNDLTRDEAGQVIDALKADADDADKLFQQEGQA